METTKIIAIDGYTYRTLIEKETQLRAIVRLAKNSKELVSDDILTIVGEKRDQDQEGK